MYHRSSTIDLVPSVQYSIPPCILEELHELPTVQIRNLGRVTDISAIPKLVRAIEDGSAIAVSDASIGTRGRSAHPYILSTECRQGYIKGEAPVDCDVEDIESTRAECYGVIALQTWIKILIDAYAITYGEITLTGDNKDSLVLKPLYQSKISFPRFFRPNTDLKLQIQEMRKALHPVKILPEHVKGHQDDREDFIYEKASIAVQCNIDVDHASKSFLKSHQGKLEPSYIAQPLPNQKSYLSINSSVIQNNMDHHVRLHFFGHRLEHRLIHKNILTTTNIANIHWRAIDRAFKKLPLDRKTATFNMIHKKWMTYMEIAKFDADKNPLCARCTTTEETYEHIYACKSSHARQHHQKALLVLKTDLRKCDTAPIIQRAIIQMLEQPRKGYTNTAFNDLVVKEEIKEIARNVIIQQNKIGKTSMLQGYLVKDWVLLQNVYLKCDDVWDEKTDWLVQVVKALWKYSTYMWKSRCDKIHQVDDKNSTSINRRDLMKSIRNELVRTRYFGDYEVRQLRRNIEKSINNSPVPALQTWLQMIRDVKESKIMLKKDTLIKRTRMQSIKIFLTRTDHA